MLRYRNPKGMSRKSRWGASAVEFALVAPVMITITFGLIEIGRLMLVKQTITHASREGARVGVRPTAVSSDINQRVQEELNVMGIEHATIESEPAMLESASPGTNVTVRVKVDIDSISWIPGFFTFGVSQIQAESSMRRESTH